jgi:site-specific recombinase XerD
MPGFTVAARRATRAFGNPADPPAVEEIVAVMRVVSGTAAAARATLRGLAVQAGVRRRFAPHQLRHAHAVEMAREGVPLTVIQRQLGHANLAITSVYLQGIDTSEIIETVGARPAPALPASTGLR